jgi:hypothetical protein
MIKKYLLLMALLPFAAIAQPSSLQISSPNVNLTGPANITLSGHATVVNVGTGLLDLTVTRTQNDTTPGHNSFYCWGGACFPAATALAPFTIPFFPGESDTTLEAKVDPRGVAGMSTVSYRFFDSGNPTDSVSITYHYTFSTVGVDELIQESSLSTASPNPADRITSITYSTGAGSSKLVITNLLGSLIKEVPIRERQGAIVLGTGEMSNGIYIYTLWTEGRPLASKRLIVSHK